MEKLKTNTSFKKRNDNKALKGFLVVLIIFVVIYFAKLFIEKELNYREGIVKIKEHKYHEALISLVGLDYKESSPLYSYATVKDEQEKGNYLIARSYINDLKPVEGIITDKDIERVKKEVEKGADEIIQKKVDTIEKNSPLSENYSIEKIWLKMSQEEKFQHVSTTIRSWKNNGFTVLADENFFINALDSFYGSPESNDISYDEAISILGINGGVLKK